MHRKPTLAVALLIALAATGGSVALADPIQLSDDRRGDTRCDDAPCPDLKSAIADTGIFDATELFYIVTQHNAVQAARIPRIAINTEGPAGSAPEYFVAKRGARTGVFDAGTGRRTGPAALRVSNSAGLSWTFRPRAIGDPGSFGWRVEVVQGGQRIDATPDSGYRKRVLG